MSFVFLFLGSCFFMVFSRNPVNLLWWLVSVFIGGAGVLWGQGWRLVSLLLVVVYAGAVVVLFLFALFMVTERVQVTNSRGFFIAFVLVTFVILEGPYIHMSVSATEALALLYSEVSVCFYLLLGLLLVALGAVVLVRTSVISFFFSS